MSWGPQCGDAPSPRPLVPSRACFFEPHHPNPVGCWRARAEDGGEAKSRTLDSTSLSPQGARALGTQRTLAELPDTPSGAKPHSLAQKGCAPQQCVLPSFLPKQTLEAGFGWKRCVWRVVPGAWGESGEGETSGLTPGRAAELWAAGMRPPEPSEEHECLPALSPPRTEARACISPASSPPAPRSHAGVPGCSSHSRPPTCATWATASSPHPSVRAAWACLGLALKLPGRPTHERVFVGVASWTLCRRLSLRGRGRWLPPPTEACTVSLTCLPLLLVPLPLRPAPIREGTQTVTREDSEPSGHSRCRLSLRPPSPGPAPQPESSAALVRALRPGAPAALRTCAPLAMGGRPQPIREQDQAGPPPSAALGGPLQALSCDLK